MRHKARLMHTKGSQTFMQMAYAEVLCGGFYAKNMYAEISVLKTHQANLEVYGGTKPCIKRRNLYAPYAGLRQNARGSLNPFMVFFPPHRFLFSVQGSNNILRVVE